MSVVIPVFNREHLIGEALASVLAQDYPAVEVIAVDDGSTDGSADVIRRHGGVRYLRQPNQGAGAARNAGVEAARGELIAFLDSDDLWLPAKLSRQVAAWKAMTEPGFVICHTRLTFAADRPLPPGYSVRMLEAPFPAFLPSTLLVSRRTFLEVGPFDPALRRGQDTDWFFRAIERGLARVVVPELLMEKRHLGDNLTGAVEATRRAMMQVLHASLQRRRRPAAPGASVQA